MLYHTPRNRSGWWRIKIIETVSLVAIIILVCAGIKSRKYIINFNLSFSRMEDQRDSLKLHVHWTCIICQDSTENNMGSYIHITLLVQYNCAFSNTCYEMKPIPAKYIPEQVRKGMLAFKKCEYKKSFK
jgi:hypothetical protein